MKRQKLLRFHRWLENVEVEACKFRSYVDAIHEARASNIRYAAQGSLFHLLLPQS